MFFTIICCLKTCRSIRASNVYFLSIIYNCLFFLVGYVLPSVEYICYNSEFLDIVVAAVFFTGVSRLIKSYFAKNPEES